jgi:hypothetical protein
MAGRVISRRALRDGHDRAARAEEEATNTDESPEPGAKSKKARVRKSSVPKPPKTQAPPKPRAKKRPAKVPPRMFARWAVCDNGLKHLAVFDYKDRAGADDKLAELRERKPGAYFLQLVKIPYNPPPPAEPAVV